MNARRNLFFIFLLLGIALTSTAAQQVAYPYKKEIDSPKKVLNTKQKIVNRSRSYLIFPIIIPFLILRMLIITWIKDLT